MILFTISTKRSLYTINTVVAFNELIEGVVDELSLEADRPVDKEELEILFSDQSISIFYVVEA